MFEVIRELYRAGIDCGIESYQGSAVVAWIVTDQNRRVEQYFDVDELERIPEWLLSEAVRSLEIAAVDRSPHELLAELADTRRKDPKRISAREREQRRQGSIQRSA